MTDKPKPVTKEERDYFLAREEASYAYALWALQNSYQYQRKLLEDGHKFNMKEIRDLPIKESKND